MGESNVASPAKPDLHPQDEKARLAVGTSSAAAPGNRVFHKTFAQADIGALKGNNQ